MGDFLYPFAHYYYGTEFVYQQDNASIHTSKESRAFLDEMETTVIDWPARSPDLNPFVVKQRCYRCFAV